MSHLAGGVGVNVALAAMRTPRSLGVAPSWAVDPKEASGINPHPRFPDDISTNDLIADIRKTPDGLERDDLYFKESLRAYNRKDFDRARALASEIIKSDSKETLLTVILYNRAQKEIESGDLEAAEQTATSQPDRTRKAEVYAQLAKAWAERGDNVRANEFMAWASSEAAKVDLRSKRAQVYIYMAGMCVERYVTKAFEFIEASVGDINSTEKFDPNSSTLLLDLQPPKGSKKTLGFARSISLISVVPQLAKADLSRLLNTARSLTAPEPRALAVIAACREVLAAKPNEKTEPPTTKKPAKPQTANKGKENKG